MRLGRAGEVEGRRVKALREELEVIDAEGGLRFSGELGVGQEMPPPLGAPHAERILNQSSRRELLRVSLRFSASHHVGRERPLPTPPRALDA